MKEVARQIEGYGIGYSVCLTAAVRHQPRLLLALLHRLPSGLWHWYRANPSRTRHTDTPLLAPGHDDTMRNLGRLERRGLRYGPFLLLAHGLATTSHPGKQVAGGYEQGPASGRLAALQSGPGHDLGDRVHPRCGRCWTRRPRGSSVWWARRKLVPVGREPEVLSDHSGPCRAA